LFTCRVFGVEANAWFEKKIVFTSCSADVRSLCKGVLFFLSNTAYERSWTIIFFDYVLDIWMDLISDLVINGLARLNLPLELNFLCIGLCQIILVLWFFMHYVHENVVVGIDLWWFPYIIQKILLFLDFLRHCFQFSKTYRGSAQLQ